MRFAYLHQIIPFSALLFFLFNGVSCVSVSIGPKGGERANDAVFTAPSAPYAPLKDEHADRAWQNSENGNSISFFSTCNDQADPSLESLSRELFSELRDLKEIRSNATTYNGREALDQEVEGKLDGILTHIRAILFKKNNCSYTLSFIGVPRAFEHDRDVFDRFVHGFKAP